jgi:uncharacterized protein YecE (DUF72 family)
VTSGVERFYERIEPLHATGKLGPVLWQLPPRFRRDEERLAEALSRLPPARHAFEFRDPTWFADDVYALLRDHGAALVIADRRGLDYQAHELTADWTYVRFHQGRRGAAAATTRTASSASGRLASAAGTLRRSPTSTTTGRRSR